MIINGNTKIAALIKYKPQALEAIVSISPKFVKLRNPLLRKMIAARASIAVAAKIGGCKIDDFFKKLQPLGFEIDNTAPATIQKDSNKPFPDFLKNLHTEKIIELDVRPLIEAGIDPLDEIIQRLNKVQTGGVLKIVNSFEPVPLIYLLERRGFESYTELITEDFVQTYFYKQNQGIKPTIDENIFLEGWDGKLNEYNGSMVTIDVRDLEMPLPMYAILEALETLPHDQALYVYHKRIPVFLLPELKERNLNFRINEVSQKEVHMLIYKD